MRCATDDRCNVGSKLQNRSLLPWTRGLSEGRDKRGWIWAHPSRGTRVPMMQAAELWAGNNLALGRRLSTATVARPTMNALRNRKIDWTMPMVCRSFPTCQMGNPTGMRQDEQRFVAFCQYFPFVLSPTLIRYGACGSRQRGGRFSSITHTPSYPPCPWRP